MAKQEVEGNSMKRREVDLYVPDVKALLSTIEKFSERDYLIFRLAAEQGFRIGEIVGGDPRKRESYCPQCLKSAKIVKKRGIIDHAECNTCNKRWETKEELPARWVHQDPGVSGLMIEDLNDDYIWVRGKGGTNKKQELDSATVTRLRSFIGGRKAGRIFDITTGRCRQLIKRYSKVAGIPDASLVHPHRLRSFVGSELKERYDVKVAQDVLRHKSAVTTLNSYVRQTPMEKRRQATETIKSLIEA
jgi:integrase